MTGQAATTGSLKWGAKSAVVLVSIAVLFLIGQMSHAQTYPRCISGCTAKDVTLESVAVIATETGIPGEPVDAEIVTTLNFNRVNSYCVRIVADVYIDGVLEYLDLVSQPYVFTAKGIYDLLLGNISWSYGSVLELRNVQIFWSVDVSLDDPSLCLGCIDYGPGSKCVGYLAFEVTQPLVAHFEGTPLIGCAPLTVQFTDLSTGGYSLAPYTYEWDFGDGTPVSTDKDPLHTFLNAGMYSVSLTVTDTNSLTDSETKTAYIMVQDCDADLYVSKYEDADPVSVGSTLTYTITAGNAGPGNASGVVVSESIPVGTSFVSASPSQGTYDSVAGAWTIGTLLSSEEVTLLLQVLVEKTAGQEVTNTVCISGNETDPNPANDCDTITTTVEHNPALLVQKVGLPSLASVGDSVNYTITAEHHISSDGSPIEITSITDSLEITLTGPTGDTNSDGFLDQNEIWTYTGARAILATDPAYLINTVCAYGLDVDGDPLSDCDSTTTTVVTGYVTITPQQATNQVGQPHTFLITAYANNGLPVNWDLVAYNVTPAALGETVTGPIISGTGLSATWELEINNANPGVFAASASVDIDFGSTVLSISTDGLGGSSTPGEKTYIDVRLSLDPPSATNQIGDDHVFTSTLEYTTDGSTWLPLSGKTIGFGITSGVGSLSSVTAITNASGQATVTLTSNTVGSTAVAASFDGIAVGAAATANDIATKDWIDVRLSLDPPSATNQIGDDHVFTATLEYTTDGSTWLPLSGKTIGFSITSGVGSLSSTTATTNASGQATVTLTSNTVGSTAVAASFDGIAVGAAATAGDTATKDWIDVRLSLDPPSATNQIGDDHVFTATLEYTLNGSTWLPLSGKPVSFLILSGPGILSTPSAITGINGEAVATLTSSVVGTTAISTSFAGVAAEATATASDTATKDWIDVRLSLDPPSATNQIGDDHVFTATLEFTTDGSTWLPLSGETIGFGITSGVGSLSSTTATTNASGQATVTLTSNAVGTTAVAASFDGIAVGAAATANDTATKDWIDVRLSLDPPSATNQIGDDHVFTATLEYTTDGSTWLPLSGETIGFGITSGVGSLNSTTATTNANGQATVTLTSNAVGTTAVAASFDGTAVGAEATANDTATKDWIDVRLSLDPPSATNQIGDDHVFTATLEFTTDGSTWLPLSGKIVSFLILSGPGILSTPSAITDINGEAVVTLTSSVVGTTAISTSFAGVAAEATATASDTATKDWIDVRLSLDPPSATNQIGDGHVFTATLEFTTDGSTWLPLSGETIGFGITSGVGSLSSTTATTNANGQATVTLTSNAVGTTAVAASFDDIAVGAAATANDTATKDWIDVRLSLDPPSATNQIGDDHVFTATLEFTTDGSTWLPLSGKTVSFLILSGSGILSTPSAITDINGEAVVTLTSSAVGTTAISTSFAGVAAEATATASDTATKDWIDVRLSLDPPSATNQIGDDHVFTATLEFTTDGSTWLPLSGETIGFGITSGVGSLSSTTATTNANGQATVTLTSNAVGTTAVAASFDGTAVGAEATAGDTATKDWINVRLSLDPPSATNEIGDDHVFTATLEFTTDGSTWLPLSGKTIGFGITSGVGSLSSTTAITNANGQATVTLTSNTVGTTVVAASFDGIAGGAAATADDTANKLWVRTIIAIDKTITDVGGNGSTGLISAAGDVISYQIIVSNEGTRDLTGISVVDPLIGTLTGPVGDVNADSILGIGETWIYTGSYAALQSDIDNNGGGDGDINNTATVSSNELPDASDSAAAQISVGPNITIVKTVVNVGGDGPAGVVDQAGDVIDYQVDVANSGNISLTGVGVSDPLLGSLSGPVGDIGSDDILGVTETWTYTGSYTVLQSDIDNNGGGDGDIDNTATVSSTELPNESDSAVAQISADPKYAIVKTVINVGGDGPGGVVDQAGDVIDYQIVVSNIGNVSLTGVGVSDPLLGTLSGPVGDINSDSILGVSETWTYTGSYTVSQSDIDDNGGGDGDIDNTATVSSTELPDASDSAAAQISVGPNITIVKTVVNVGGDGPAGVVDQAGDVIDYQIVVSNIGNVSLTGVGISDPLLGSLSGPVGDVGSDDILGVSETWIYTGNYTVLQSDIDNNGGGDGDIDNTATVSSTELPNESDSAVAQINVDPGYAIAKTVINVGGEGPAGVVDQAGDVIDYQIVVSNTGNQSLTDVDVSDSRIELIGPSESVSANNVLNVGETWTYTGSYTVSQSDIDNDGGGDGDIDNTATVSSSELPAASDSAVAQINVDPSYAIAKTVINVGGDGPAGVVDQAGDVIDYQIVVSNSGNVTLTGVGVSDPLLSILSGPVGDVGSDGILGASETWTYTGSYTVLQSDIDNNGGSDGDIDNTATVFSNELPNQEDSVTVPLSQAPGYTIDKSAEIRDGGSAVDQAGDIIDYSIVVTNIGNQSLTGIGVSDSLIVLAGPSESVSANSVLNVGETWTYTGSYTVLQSDIDSNGGDDGDIDNTATVSSNELPNQEDSVTVPLNQAPGYTIGKSAEIRDGGSAVDQAGDIIDYTIVIANTGNQSLTGITLSDPLLEGINGQLGVKVESLSINGTLNVGETWTYTGNYTVLQSDIDSNGGGDTDIDNTATVTSNELPSESDTRAVPIAFNPNYSIQKSAVNVGGDGETGVADRAGDVIDYRVVVTNAGNVSLTGIVVTDPLIGTLSGPVGDIGSDSVLAVSETWTYTGSYTVSQSDIDNNGGGDGDIDNTATVSSNELPNQADSIAVPLRQEPSYAIDKSADIRDGQPTVDQAGDIIDYTIVITNTGNQTITGVSVSDSLVSLTGPTESVLVNGILDVSESWTYIGSYTVQQTTIDSNGIDSNSIGDSDGDIDNTATVVSTQLASQQDSVAVPLQQSAGYVIEKTANVRDGELYVDQAGDIIDYTIVVTNTGNQTITGVDVSDNLVSLTGPTESVVTNGILDVSEAWTYTGSYTVLQSDIDNDGGGDSDVDNSATVTSNELPSKTDVAAVHVTQGPAYSINKTISSVDGTGNGNIDHAGEIIRYQIVITNTGNQSLTGVNLADPLLEGANGTVSVKAESLSSNDILNVGETWTYTGSYTVQQSDIDNNGGGDGDIDNTAKVSSNELASQQDSAAVPLQQNAGYALEKTADVRDGELTIDQAGDIIDYTIVVTNTGNQSLTGVGVSDNLISLTGPTESVVTNGILDVSETWTYTGSYTVLQSDIDDNGGDDADIDNTATVFSNELPDEDDSVDVPLSQEPGYAIEKTARIRDAVLFVNQAGDIIDYTIVVTNIGNQSLTGIGLSDPRLEGVNGDLSAKAESLSSNDILNVGETWTYTGSYTVQQSDIDNNGGGDGDIDNTAKVSSNELASQQDSAAVPLQQNAGYALEKTADVRDGELTIDQAGDIIDYTIVITNTGNQTITGVGVSDNLVSLTGPTESVVTNGILDVSETWTYTGSYTVLQSDIDDNGGGDADIDNTATVSSSELPDQQDSAAVQLSQAPGYSIEKSSAIRDGELTVDQAGDIIDYTIVVANTGNQSLTGVGVSDSLIGLTGPTESISANGVLNVGETWTYTGTYTVLQSDIDDNGGDDADIDNTATVSSNELPDQQDSAAVQLSQAPGYSIEKSAAIRDGELTIDQAGDIIDYTIVIANTGNQSLTGVGVSDNLIGLSGLSESISTNGILNVGETWTYTGAYTVQQADIDDNGGGDGDIDNTATVSSNELPDQQDFAAVQLSQTPGYSIEKLAGIRDGELTVDQAGDIIDYTIVVANTGNQSLTGVDVSDSLISLTGPSESISANGVLNVGETWTYTGTYTVLQSDIDVNGGGDGDIDNTATVSSNELLDQQDSALVPLLQDAGYIIEKSAAIRDGELTIDQAGDIIDYTILVTNTGNLSLTGVGVFDNLIGLTGPLESVSTNGILNVGETWTYVGAYTVQQADIDDNGGGDSDIDNTATVSSNELPDQQDSESVQLSQAPGYSIEKLAAIRDGELIVDQAGDIIDYTIVVTNTGNQSLTSVNVSDSLVNLIGPTESISVDGTLGVGEVWIYTGSYTVLQSDIDENGGGDGDIDNTATVSSNELLDQQDSAAVQLSQAPGYSIEKSATVRDGELTIDQAGDIVDYTIVVANTGNQSLIGVGVSDSVIGLTGPAESLSTDSILNVGETWTYTGSYTVLQSDIDDNGGGDGDIDNTATVSSNELPDQQASAAVQLTQAPGYSIEKSAAIRDGGLAVDQAGDIIDYAIVVSNTGNQSLTGVGVSDSLISLTGPSESISANSVLNVGETWTYTGSYTVLQSDIDENGGEDGDIDNTATVSSNELSDQQGSAIVPLLQDAGYVIEKSATIRDSELTVDQAGDIIDYTIVVTNTGNQSLTSVSVSDSLISLTGPSESVSTNGVLNVGENWTYTGSYTVQQSDIDDNGGGDGDIDNTATVLSTELPSEEDSEDTPLTHVPSLIIEKTGDAGPVRVGESVSYAIVITNTGNVTLNNVTVTDPLLGISQNLGTIAPGDARTISSSYGPVPASDLPGPLVNTATAVSDETSPKTDDHQVDLLPQGIDLSLFKTVDKVIPEVGELVTFDIRLSNGLGFEDATNVEVTDTLPEGYEFVGFSVSQGTYTYSGIYSLWEVGDLPSGSTAILTIFATVREEGSHVSPAEVTAQNEDDIDSIPANAVLLAEDDDDEAVVWIDTPIADLLVIKSVDNANPNERDIVVFTISVYNGGPYASTGIVLQDVLPSGLTYVSDTAGGAYNAATNAWDVGDLLVGQQVSFTMSALVDAGTAGSTSTNTALIIQNEVEDPSPANNQDSADVTVGETSDECDGRIVISEIAWAGTAANVDDEWIELRNIGGEPVDVTGWVLRWRMKQPVNPEDSEWKTIALSGEIQASSTPVCELQDLDPEPTVEFIKREVDDLSWFVEARPVDYDESYMILERKSDLTISNINADIIYDQVSPYSMDLSNDGEVIELLDANGNIMDTANAFPSDEGNWPAGDAITRGTMERIDPLGEDERDNWHTNLGIITQGLDAEGRPLIASADLINEQTLEEMELFIDLNAVKTLPGARLEVGLDLSREVRLETGWPWIRISRPGYDATVNTVGGGGGVEPAYSFASRYANDTYWLGIDTAGLVPGDYLVWVVYGAGQTVLVPITILGQ